MLIIDDATTWPDRVTKLLAKSSVIELFQRHEFVDYIDRHPVLRPILAEIEEIIRCSKRPKDAQLLMNCFRWSPIED